MEQTKTPKRGRPKETDATRFDLTPEEKVKLRDLMLSTTGTTK